MKKFLILFLSLLTATLFSVALTACEKHTHKFDRQVVAEKYINEQATATTNATYFYSCSCGAKGQETFEKEKEEHTLTLSQSVISAHNKTYDKKLLPNITASDLGIETDAVIKTYYKTKGADDSTYTEIDPRDVGNYTAKVVVEESVEYKNASTTFDFEITPIYGEISANITSWSYVGDTEFLIPIAPSKYAWNIEGSNITTTITTSSKDVGTYSTADGTLTITCNYTQNYVITGTFKITPKQIRQVDPIEIVLQEGVTNYTVNLTNANGIIEGDEVQAGIYVSNDITTAGEYDLYWKHPGSGSGITLWDKAYAQAGEGLMGKDAKNYEFVKNTLSGKNIYYIKAKIIVPTAE